MLLKLSRLVYWEAFEANETGGNEDGEEDAENGHEGYGGDPPDDLHSQTVQKQNEKNYRHIEQVGNDEGKIVFQKDSAEVFKVEGELIQPHHHLIRLCSQNSNTKGSSEISKGM